MLLLQTRSSKRFSSHFERVIGRRHEQLFSSITTVEQWERRKQQARAALTRMLWHDMRWPDGPPPATVTHREQRPGYTIENLVIETAPKLFLTANLYYPQNRHRTVPGRASTSAATRASTCSRVTARGLPHTASRPW